MTTPVDIYISYAREDDALRRELEAQLSPLRQVGMIRSFHSQEVPPGMDWRKAIETQLAAARIVLILMSSSYFHSKTRHDFEMLPALSLGYTGKAIVIPILVRAVLWEVTPLARLSLLPTNRVPVINWPDHDAAWKDVVAGILHAVNNLNATRSDATTNVASQRGRSGGILYAQGNQNAARLDKPSTNAAPQRGSSGAPWKRLAALALLVSVALTGWHVLRQNSISVTDATNLPSAPIDIPGPSRVAMSGGTCGPPCCGGESCVIDKSNALKLDVCPQGSPRCRPCPSGRTCILGSCTDVLPEARSYALRLAHAVVDGREVSDVGNVCMRRTNSGDAWSCILYTDAADRTSPRPPQRAAPVRPVVTVGDMMFGKGLDIVIREGSNVIASGSGIAHDNVGIAALCRGLRFKIPAAPGKTEVEFYLDDL